MNRTIVATVTLIMLSAVAPTASEAYTSARAPDGRILMHEEFRDDHFDGQDVNGVTGQARLLGAGSLDPGFGRNGFQIADAIEDHVPDGAHLAYDSQARILVAFQARGPWSVAAPAYLRRLLPDGTIDRSFGTAGQRRIATGHTDLRVTSLVVLANGGLLVGGSTPDPNRYDQRMLAVLKLNADGRPAAGFGTMGLATAVPVALGPVAQAAARHLHVLGDGRILAGGERVIARFKPDGSLDRGFGAAGVITSFYLSSVAIDGNATYVASSPGPPGGIGIVVQRLRKDGSPDPAWASGGATEFPLSRRQYVDDNGDGEPDGGVQVSYTPGDLVVLPGGGLLVGVTENEEDYTFVHGGGGPCPTGRGIPLLLRSDGTLERQFAAFGRSVERVMRAPGGELYMTGQAETVDSTSCSLGVYMAESFGLLARFEPDGDPLGTTPVRPVREPPDVTIEETPPTAPGTITGFDASFRFEVLPGVDDGGDAVLRCSIDLAPWTPCAAEHTFTGVSEGPRALRVQALGVNGARGPIHDAEWTQNHAAPDTALTAAPAGTVAAREATLVFAASEPASFACTVDGGVTEACKSPLQLANLSDGPHSVQVRATDRLGAVESAPATAEWTVDTASWPPRLWATFRRRTGPYTVTVRAPRGAGVRVSSTVLISGRAPMSLPAVRGRGRAGGTTALIVRLDRRAHRALADTRARASLRVRSTVITSGEQRVDTLTRRLPD